MLEMMRSFREVMICVILVAWVAFGISGSHALHEETALMANKGRVLHDASGDFAQFGVSIFIVSAQKMHRIHARLMMFIVTRLVVLVLGLYCTVLAVMQKGLMDARSSGCTLTFLILTQKDY